MQNTQSTEEFWYKHRKVIYILKHTIDTKYNRNHFFICDTLAFVQIENDNQDDKEDDEINEEGLILLHIYACQRDVFFNGYIVC
jgi:hypothetical protein